MTYDVIIIGAGLGGLSSGLVLAKNNKKVLILEKNDLPGGLFRTIRKGRFDFDLSGYELYGIGTNEHTNNVYSKLKELEIELPVTAKDFNWKINTKTKKDAIYIRGQFTDLLKKIEEIKSGSASSLEKLLEELPKIIDGYQNLKKGHYEEVKKNYTFIKYLNMTTLDALNNLKMPKESIEILECFWPYLECPFHKLNFISFAIFLEEIIQDKETIISIKNTDLILKMLHKFEENSGTIYTRSEVVKIKETLTGYDVYTKDEVYHTKKVICNCSKKYILQDLFHVDLRDIMRVENARTLAPSTFAVYLGLNRDNKTLGLVNDHYSCFTTLNGESNYKTMKNFHHSTWDAYVPNNYNPNVSPNNTCILVLKTMYFQSPFNKIKKSQVKALEYDLANDLICQFEEINHLDISPYIEEMVIVSPYTISRTTNNLNGTIKGYMRLGYDAEINRLINKEEEKIKNMYFVGSSGNYGGGINRAILNGIDVGREIIREEANYER